MKIRLRGIFFCFLVLAFVGIAVGNAIARNPVVRIGIVLDGPPVRFADDVDTYKKVLHTVLDAEYDVRFPEDRIISGEWSVASINNSIDRLLSDPKVDVILSLGPVASHEACKRRNLKKTVIAPFVVDATAQNLPLKDGTSGVKNLYYVNSFNSVGRSIQTFKDITSFEHMAVLADAFTIQSIPELRKLAHQQAAKQGVKLSVIDVGSSVEDALQAITPQVEAVMVTSLEQFPSTDFQKLVDGLIKRGLPSYSYSSPGDVERGIMGSTTPREIMQNIARHVGINLQEILGGENAATIPVGFKRGEKLTINMATARAIGVYPGWKVRTEADLINENIAGQAEMLTIDEVVQLAITVNLDLAVAEKNVAAGEQRVYESRSRLLPQIDIGASGVIIDKDRAETSLNQTSERTVRGSATATQLIYSDKVWADFSVQKHLQTSRMEERDSLQLDIVRSAATAYLNVLRANAIELIQKDNLKLTRENLERARIRQSIGAAGPEEVYRWESQIADSRQAVLLSESISLDAMTALNRVLNRPLRDNFQTAEEKPGDPMGILENQRLVRMLSDPQRMGMFRDFVLQEGLYNAPELRGLEAGILARERIVASSRREFWLPTFSLAGDVTETFVRDGEGSDNTSGRDDTDWSAGVFATFPLFASGRDVATYRRTREELKQLRIQQKAVSQRIEERVLNSIHLIRASYPGIELSQDALTAASKNLELVTDSYVRGIKSIIELLDAQNQALVANQKAANAVYDFMIDMMTVQRSMGQFVLFADDETREEFFQKLDMFLKNTPIREPQS